MTPSQPGRVAVVGGTGALGIALVKRLARAGHQVVIGSRTSHRALSTARDLSLELGCTITGAGNTDAAREADIVLMAAPYGAHTGTLEDIRPAVQGKIVIDTTVPLVPPKVMRVQLPPEGSAAQHAQMILGPNVRVISAFHNVSARKLAVDGPVDCDVLVFGDDKSDRDAVVRLNTSCGLRALHGGGLVNSAAAEAMTSVLIFLNKAYSVDGAGIRITGPMRMPDG